MQYINISGYKFLELSDLDLIQQGLAELCQSLDLKGTLLLGHEGINAFASGTREQIDQFKTGLDAWIPGLEFKESPSSTQPFKKMQVKIKPEIVTFGVPDVNPITSPAPYISADRFQEWMDNNEDIIVLDTRNDYEVHLGQFKKAMILPIQNFRQFPEAINALPEEMKNKTIVTYCTGGIRCEKAAPYLIQQGFTNVYQLEGGILKYLEKYPDSHFEGSCFVFDARMAVGSDLHQIPTHACSVCRQPLTDESQICPACS